MHVQGNQEIAADKWECASSGSSAKMLHSLRRGRPAPGHQCPAGQAPRAPAVLGVVCSGPEEGGVRGPLRAATAGRGGPRRVPGCGEDTAAPRHLPRGRDASAPRRYPQGGKTAPCPVEVEPLEGHAKVREATRGVQRRSGIGVRRVGNPGGRSTSMDGPAHRAPRAARQQERSQGLDAGRTRGRARGPREPGQVGSSWVPAPGVTRGAQAGLAQGAAPCR